MKLDINLNKSYNFYIKNKRIIDIILFGFLFFIVFLTVNSRIPSEDDLYYCCTMDTKQPIQNINQIIEFQKVHYLEWGGRLPAHTLLQLLFLIGKPFSSIILTIIFFLLSYIITKFASEKFDMKYLFLTSSLLVFLNPAFDETLLWMTGAANYLCMSLVALLGLYPFVKYLKDSSYKVYNIFLSVIVSFFAGWTNENIGITLIMIMIYCLYDYYINNKKLSIWMLLNIISTSIGFAFLILSPGNFVRGDSTASGIMKILYRFHGQINAFGNWLLPVLILLLILIFIAYRLKIKLNKIEIVFIISGLFSMLVMFASPTYPSRATFGSLVFLLIPIISLITKTINKDEINNKFITLVILIKYSGLIGKYLSISLVAIARSMGSNIPG